MKQKTRGILICCISILLLVPAVVSHHHHGERLCFVFEEFTSHHHAEESDEPCCTHHQEESHNDTNHSEEESCILHQIQDIVATVNYKKYHVFDVSLQDHSLLLQAVLFNINDPFNLLEDQYDFRQIPYLISYYSEYVSRSLGLRAPPFA